MEDKISKFEALLKNEEEAKRVLVPSVEETRKNLAALGMDFTEEELNEIAAGAIDAIKTNDELAEGDLEAVAGGAKANRNSDYYKAGQKAGKILGNIFTLGLPFVTGIW